MIIIFGKGKVGKWLNMLLDKLDMKNIMMDDLDRDEIVLKNAKKIICSPGVKQDHQLYQKYGNKVFSELNFLWNIIKEQWLDNLIEFIWVTGTNGKSSSVHIMYELFKWIFEELKINIDVYLSGNFWTPLSETLCEILDKKNNNVLNKNLIILECSSFMLYKLSSFSFDYSILTNLWIDHLDWHKDLDEYFDSKFNIINFTKKYVTSDNDSLLKYKERIKKSDTKIFENTRIEPYQRSFDLTKTKFLWEHNKWNWNAIYKLIREYFDNNELMWNEKVFENIAKIIEPLNHRMKNIKNIKFGKRNIKIYDDGICTSGQALNAALGCFDEKIILIAGGYDKWEDYNWISNELWNKVWFACLIWQTAKKFAKILDEKNIEYKIFDNLNLAIDYCVEKAKNDNIDNILFSPWSASFDMFKNVYDRCDQFCSAVDKI